MKVGDRVIRKNYKGGIGAIERIRQGYAYIRWINALRPFTEGYSDNHSTVKLDYLLEANEDNLARQAKAKLKRKIKWAKKRYDECKDWYYCPHCHTRFMAGGYTCYQCGEVNPDQVEKWIDCSTGKRVVKILNEEAI